MRKQKLYLHSHNQLRNLYNELHVYDTNFPMHVCSGCIYMLDIDNESDFHN